MNGDLGISRKFCLELVQRSTRGTYLKLVSAVREISQQAFHVLDNLFAVAGVFVEGIHEETNATRDILLLSNGYDSFL